eukprot:g1509.t1
MQAPVLVINQNTKRETGRKAQLGNITAAKAVADIIRTTMGPRSMLKMLLDPMGGIVLTNDGHAILREVDVSHPAAKSMLELSRAQDEEVGDGTTSVIVLSGELLTLAAPFLNIQRIHPTVIVQGFYQALEKALEICEKIAVKVDLDDQKLLRQLIASVIGTKFTSRYGDKFVDMAIKAVQTVTIKRTGRRAEVDIKKYAKVEKIPGGDLKDCRVLNGVMINKDVTHHKMKRKITNPRVLLLDCPLEYKKPETSANVELTEDTDFEALLKEEEDAIKQMCADIISFKPDIVFTEKGLSDLAQYYFVKNGITAIRRLRKTDNNRIARATGATIVHRTDEISESDIGTKCGLFEVRKIGDDYFTFLEECKDPKACTIVLRGASKDVLMEVERNLQDAMRVAKNLMISPKVVPGGGATEMAIARELEDHSSNIAGVHRMPFLAVAKALEVIPRTLLENCGADVVRQITALRAKHASKGDNRNLGVDGVSGKICLMNEVGIWDSFEVKIQTIKTAIESSCMLLRIDDIVSGLTKTQD